MEEKRSVKCGVQMTLVLQINNNIAAAAATEVARTMPAAASADNAMACYPEHVAAI
jgi:hypothetical protein